MRSEVDLFDKVSRLVADCKSLTVTSDDEYKDADKGMSLSANLEKEVEAYFKDEKAEAKARYDAIRLKEKGALDVLKDLINATRGKMSEYRAERKRIEREKREAEQQRHEAEAKIEAFKLAEGGVPQEAVDAVIELSKQPVSLAPVAELRGKTSFTVDYAVSVIQGQEHLIPKEILEPTTRAMVKAVEAKIKAIVKTTGGKPIPGVLIEQTESARRRGIR